MIPWTKMVSGGMLSVPRVGGGDPKAGKHIRDKESVPRVGGGDPSM